MLTYNRTQVSPWSRAILPALLQGTLPSVSPKGMAAHKTKVAAVIDKSSNQISVCSKGDIECISLISFTLHMPIPFPPQSSPQKATQVSPVPAHSL